MSRMTYIWIMACLCMISVVQAGRPPYPVIFVHGLAGSDLTFEETMEYLVGEDDSQFDWSTNFDWGEGVNVFDIVLNADNSVEEASYSIDGESGDVRWEDFTHDVGARDVSILLGRRQYNPEVGSVSPGEYTHEWNSSYVYAVNFMEERIEGANSESLFDYSNTSSIFKQGLALRAVIAEVLTYTGASKVVLVGHSMGGLAIREYLQRKSGDSRKWWIDGSDNVDGHRVARVVTIGTPHLGSNAGTDDPTLLLVGGIGINNESESMRDLRYSYDSYPGCDDNPFIGLYLYGGNEMCLEEGFWNWNMEYWNIDVNCNGVLIDEIDGINVDTSYNDEMPLPENIQYTWIVSNSLDGESVFSLIADMGFGEIDHNGIPGDGCVLLEKQWLYDNDFNSMPIAISDTLMTNYRHMADAIGSVLWLGEGSDFHSIIRGLDEPDRFNLAYEISIADQIQGTLTTQSNQVVEDVDCYYFSLESASHVTIAVSEENIAINRIRLYNEDEDEIAIDISSPLGFDIDLAQGKYYLQIRGTANDLSWQYPYTITTSGYSSAFIAAFSANRTTGTAPLSVSFTDQSAGNIASWEWDFDGDGLIDSYQQNPIFSYAQPGVYDVELTVRNGALVDSELKAGYITVCSDECISLSTDSPVSPVSAPPGSAFEFNVTYYNTSGVLPDSDFIFLHVLVENEPPEEHHLSPVAGANGPENGRHYRITGLTFPGGDHRFYFAANIDGETVANSPSGIMEYHEFSVEVTDVVTLVSPSDNAEDVSRHPDFYWSSVTGATSYDFAIYDYVSGQLTQILYEGGLAGTQYSYTGNILDYSEGYSWTVRARIGTEYGPWATLYDFTVRDYLSPPVLYSPAAGAVNLPLQPSFDWQSLSNADQYRIEVAEVNSSWDRDYYTTSSDFDWPNAEALTPSTDYSWQVRAYSSDGNSDWSALRYFRTGGDVPPGAPTLMLPANGSTEIELSATLTWEPGNGVATAFDLQVSEDSQFSNIILESNNIAGHEYVLPIATLSEGTSYWWRTRGRNASGAGTYATPFTFTTVISAQEAGTVLWQLDGVDFDSGCVFDADGYIYANSNDDLVKVDPESGEEMWRLLYFCREDLELGPTVSHDGNTVYTIVDNGQLGEIGNDYPHLAAVDPSGSVNWFSTLPAIDAFKPVLDSSGNIYISMMDLNDTGTHDVIASYTSQGVERWRFSFSVDSHMNGPPVVVGNKVIVHREYFTQSQVEYTAKVYAFSTANGALLWTRNMGEEELPYRTVPAINGNSIVFGTNNASLYGLSLTNGGNAAGFPRTGLYDDLEGTVLIDSAGNLYSGTDDTGTPLMHTIYKFTSNGDVIWSHQLPGSFGQQSVLGDDGVWYFHNRSVNTLFAVSTDTGESLWSLNLGSGVRGLNLTNEGVLIVGFYGAPTGGLMAIQTTSSGLMDDAFWPVQFHDYHGSGCFDAPQPVESPSGLICSQGTYSDQVELSWLMNAPSDHVEVFRALDINGTYMFIGNSATEELSDTNVQPGTHYYYKIRNSFGGSLSALVPVSGVEGWAVHAIAPVLLSVSQGSDEAGIQIEWTQLEDADSYNVYVSDSQNGTYERVGLNLTSASYHDTAASFGIRWYQVTANYGGVESDPSNSLSGWRKLVMSDVAIEIVSGFVTLSWESLGEDVSFEIHASNDAYFLPSSTTMLSEVLNSYFAIQMTDQKKFFTVVAKIDLPGNVEDMVLVQSGTFTMGQSGVATPEHQVNLTNDFLLGRHEVTNQEYCTGLNWALGQGLLQTASESTVTAHGVELLNLNAPGCEIEWSGSSFVIGAVGGGEHVGLDAGSHPVKEVSWFGAACYCDWMSLQNSLPAYYNGTWEPSALSNPYTSEGYRLPTEAEWEFAAQFNDERPFPWGSESPVCELANYVGCVGWSDVIGSRPSGASSLGLLDLSGNVREWCNDWYGEYGSDAELNPIGPASGSLRVIRGGGWGSSTAAIGCAVRRDYSPSAANPDIGFRICRTIESTAVNGLIVHYPLDGNAQDLGPNAHHGSMVGPLEVAQDRFGQISSALGFDGESTYIEVPHHLDLALGDVISLSVWFKRNLPTDPYGHQRFLSKWEAGDGARHEYLFGLDYQDDFKVRGTVGHWQNDAASANAPDGTWHHAVLTSDGTTISLYLDGELESAEPHETANTIGDFGPLYIGGGGSSNPMPVYIFDGLLDDLRIYDAVLADSEIQELYHDGGWPVLNHGLIGHFPLNGNAEDFGSENRDGMINGSVVSATDRFGNSNACLEFNGVDGSISLGDAYDSGQELSFSIWACFDETYDQSAYQIFISKHDDSSNQDKSFFVGKNGGTGSFYSRYYDGDLDGVDCSSAGFPVVNHWYHIVSVFDNGNSYLYIDGVLADSESSERLLNDSLTETIIGSTQTPLHFMDGKLDDLRVYNRVLSIDEVQSLYGYGGWPTP